MYGVYDSTKIGHIWSMGTSYMIADDGANFGNLYGLAYKHTNNSTGGTMAGGHQAVWCDNGSPRAAMGYNGFWAAGGFYKNGSSDSYVLLGGGGHKAESSLSVSYVANSDKVDNIHANGLLTAASLGASGNSTTLSVTVGGTTKTGSVTVPYANISKHTSFSRCYYIPTNGTVDTGINPNAGYYGRSYLIISSCHYNDGNSTSGELYILRCGYSGNNYSLHRICSYGVSDTPHLEASIVNGQIRIKGSGANFAIMMLCSRDD